MKNNISIDNQVAVQLANGLNELLGNFQIYYQNLRGFHWNIKGKSFFELHLKFEQLYNGANLAVDQIAERILTLGGTPLHTFTDYLKIAKIEEAKNYTDSQITVSTTVNNLTYLIGLERNLLKLSADADDEGTNTLMSDLISAQEKTVWMLTSYLS